MDNEKIEKDNIVLDSKDLYIKEKLEKYKKGNFVLDSKHLYAKERLEKIRDQMLDLIGGAKNSNKQTKKSPQEIRDALNANLQSNVPKEKSNEPQQKINISDKQEKYSIENLKNEMNKLEDSIEKNPKSFLLKNDFNEFEKNIKKNIEKLPQDSKINMNDFNKLMDADSKLVEIFQQYNDIKNNSFDGIDDKDKFQSTLLSIQKNLFKLQIKIIFNKLNLIKNNSNINITPIFDAINDKIINMYSFINNQENESKQQKKNEINKKII